MPLRKTQKSVWFARGSRGARAKGLDGRFIIRLILGWIHFARWYNIQMGMIIAMEIIHEGEIASWEGNVYENYISV